MNIYVGIDPQPDNISICAIKHQVDHYNLKQLHYVSVIYWVKHKLKLKTTFNKAEDWQRYVINETRNVFDKLSKHISKYNYKTVFISVEQQRGRVNSLIEQTLFTVSMSHNYETHSTGPMLWKSLINMKRLGSNTNNKIEAKTLVLPIYEQWVQCKIDKKFRVHDLCDAYLIAWALLISKYGDQELLRVLLNRTIQNASQTQR